MMLHRMLAKFAEDDRLEQLNAQKRRLKQEQHKREVERLIAEKRAMYEAQKAAEAAAMAAHSAEQARLGGLVDEERRRLLREAAGLLDYLPKGVAKDRSEYDFLVQLTQDKLDMGGPSR